MMEVSDQHARAEPVPTADKPFCFYFFHASGGAVEHLLCSLFSLCLVSLPLRESLCNLGGLWRSYTCSDVGVLWLACVFWVGCGRQNADGVSTPYYKNVSSEDLW